MAEVTPVTLLTGFLGAGKTTLLKHLLRQPVMAHTAVLVNEFGEIGLDHLLMEKVDPDTVLLNAGCLCCTVRGDLVRVLRKLLPRARRDEITRVVIETTGLADPAPILATLIGDPAVASAYRLDGVVTVVDALFGETQLDAQFEAVRQVAVADRIVLSKTDLADPVALRARLAHLNPGAPVIEAAFGAVDAAALLAAGPFDPKAKIPDVAGWLHEEAISAEEHAGGRRTGDHGGHEHHDHGPRGEADGHSDHDHGHRGDAHSDHDHGFHRDGAGHPDRHAVHGHHAPHRGAAQAGSNHHEHDHNRHDAHIQAFCITLEEPLAWQGIGTWLEMLMATRGDALLRVKGILNLAGQPKPVAIHGVQHVLHPPTLLPAWPEGDPRTSRLVFITRDLPRAAIEDGLRAFAQAARG